jgi:hypothetical protein
LDTRTKIIDTPKAESIANAGAIVVSGYFDPVTAGVAERLASLKDPGSPLLVLIRTPANAILPSRARAELVAALAAVDYVCENGESIKPSVSLETEHSRQLTALTKHVHARQKAAI